VKRRKKRGVYFVNRPAPTERAWLLERGATEEDMAFPDPKSDPVAGLFPDPALKEKFAPLLGCLARATSRELLFDDARGLLFRAFLGVGPPDRAGDHPEGLVLVRAPDTRSRIPGLPDDAPGARDLIPFYRGGLGGLAGGDDLVGLAAPGEVLLWSKARKHDLNHVDFLPEHRTKNLRIFWDEGDGPEVMFDASGRVFDFRGGDRLSLRSELVGRFLEEKAVRIAAGKGADPLTAEEVAAAAPGHFLVEVARLRAMDFEAADAADLRAAVRRAEAAGATREELADLNLMVLAREERWDDYISEMRRLALGPSRSMIDRPVFWSWFAKATSARARGGDFREVARAAAAGPLSSPSRGVIFDRLIEASEVDAAVAVLELWMRPGRTTDPEVTKRIERLRSLRRGGG
jgi:hypothetical protein